MEVAAGPAGLLFLDEPTSGLDLNRAMSIARLLRKLTTKMNLAILCTIHQPSTLLFGQFNDLLLLTRGGRQAYMGPIGELGSNAVYFKGHGAADPYPYANQAEYIIETTGPEKDMDWPSICAESVKSSRLLQEIEEIENIAQPTLGKTK